LARRFTTALDRFCDRLNRLTEAGIAFLLAATVAVTFLQVVCRYGLDSSLSWSEEFSRYAFIWGIFLGAGSVARRGQHMAVDALRTILSGRPRHLLEIFVGVAGILFFAVFGYTAVLLTDNAMGQISTALEIPIAAVYVSAPLGAALSVLHLANGIIQGFAGVRQPEGSGAILS
jgi:TRAP-type C4-dicarboxylate transport system permease small subunit